jgi:carbonic anhydrase/acetyltransferase-like protein (isoleucine patch superfamily)
MIRSHKGKTPNIGKNVYIDPMALVIGDVTIGDDCSVWPGAVIRGDVNTIVIGNRTNIQDNVVIHTSHSVPVFIGDNVTIGHLAHVHSATIGHGVMIGSRSVVLDECVIADTLSDWGRCVGFPSLKNPFTFHGVGHAGCDQA